MCSIVGIRRPDGAGTAAADARAMLVATAHRGPDGCGVSCEGLARRAAAPDDIQAPPEGVHWAMGHSRLAITGTVGDQPMAGRPPGGKPFIVGVNGEIWNHAEIRRKASGSGPKGLDTDSLAVPLLLEAAIAKSAGPSPLEAVTETADMLDGEYAFAYMDGTHTVLCRDPLGIKPLYFSSHGGTVAFASERKALWGLGLDPQRVPPNSAVMVAADGVTTRPRAAVAPPEARPFSDRGNAKRSVANALWGAVAKRVHGHERVGVVFSGGVDSALVAAAAERAGAKPVCFVAGAAGSPDVEAARKAADEMGLDLVVAGLTQHGVHEALPDLLRAVEERNQLHVETALPLHFVVEQARRRGVRVLLTGQGADELFGGYAWYPAVFEREGPGAVRRRMDDDRDRLHVECLEREDKVSMAHSVELRVPYLDPAVVQAAARVPVEYQLAPGDRMCKRMHREIAESWGLPHDVAWRPKVAAQHGSGSRRLLAAASRALGPVPAGYDAAQSVGERLGSNQRYGHRYMDDRASWDLDGPIQWALDQLWLRESLGTPHAREELAESLGVTVPPEALA